MTIYERMKNDPEWNNSTEPPLETESTTFKSSNDDSEIEFENTSGLAKKYLKMTIGELVLVRGGVVGLKDWVNILKGLTTIIRDEQLIKERKNELVEKDFIISNVKKYLDLFMSNAFDIVESQNKIISSALLFPAIAYLYMQQKITALPLILVLQFSYFF